MTTTKKILSTLFISCWIAVISAGIAAGIAAASPGLDLAMESIESSGLAISMQMRINQQAKAQVDLATQLLRDKKVTRIGIKDISDYRRTVDAAQPVTRAQALLNTLTPLPGE